MGLALAPDPSGGASAFLLEGTSEGLAPGLTLAALDRGSRCPDGVSSPEASSSARREGATSKASSSPDEISQISSVKGPTL